MKTFFSGWRCLTSTGLSIVVLLGALLSAPLVHAESNYLNTWRSLYPSSNSDAADCQLCHGAGGEGNINPYGFAMAACNPATSGTISQRIQAAEGPNSDGDVGGFSNLDEINASTQPGWTNGLNDVWGRNNCVPQTPDTAPNNLGTPLDPTPAPEICDNGIDDNDNGLIDCEDPACDGFVDGATSCGVGECAATGNLVCQTPDQVDNCTPGAPQAEGPFREPSCRDGLDNDCDGATDLDDPNCAEPLETCDNGIDDNLNGLVDCADPQCDNFVYGATSCGVGACSAAGQSVCQTPDIVDTCQPGTPGGEGPFGDATCGDGIDNDCDGLTDAADPDCAAPPEICDNGVDDNGNGLIDCADPQCDGFQDGACATGNPGICADGTFVCQNLGQVCEQNQPAGIEGPFGNATCEDGLDNDCDGLTDAADPDCDPVPEICDDGVDNSGNGLVDCADPACDGFVNGACDTGNEGICAAGTTACRELQQFCDQNEPEGTEGPFDSPTCTDGVDNDCDGLSDAADPDCAVPPEVCDNGTDDNGNGLIDCQDPQCDGVTFGACDTGNPGVCSAGTLTCDGSDIGPVCTQDQAAGVEGPFGSPSCGDGLDNDCDGLTDAADPDCDEPVVEICDNSVDDTGNGLVDCADPECDNFVDGACDTGNAGICAAGTFVCQNGGQACVQDQQPGVEGPFGSPTCNDDVDNDCDGLTDADDPDCATPVADVFLSRLQVPKKLNVKEGQVVNRKATARGDGTLLTQDATVVLSGVASPNLGVVVEPGGVTEQVVPGNPKTKFGFTVFVSCNAAGAGTVDWTATISAPGNDDPSNDVLTGTTSVTCR